jgi:hypothetical protein
MSLQPKILEEQVQNALKQDMFVYLNFIWNIQIQTFTHIDGTYFVLFGDIQNLQLWIN